MNDGQFPTVSTTYKYHNSTLKKYDEHFWMRMNIIIILFYD